MTQQNKKKIEYVDQFRKISTLEKLPPLEYTTLKELFQQKVTDNNQLLRLKKQPTIEEGEEKSQSLLKNKLVEFVVENNFQAVSKQYQERNEKITEQARDFAELSKKNIVKQNKKQNYKFFYGKASPPPTINKSSINKEAYTILPIDQNNFSQANKDLNKIFSYADKFNFHEINNKRIEMEDLVEKKKIEKVLEKEDNSELIEQKFIKFSKYKTIPDIMKINEMKFLEEEFKYRLDKPSDKTKHIFESKFLYKSTISNNKVPVNIEEFRNIGLPSRSLQNYTAVYFSGTDFKSLIDDEEEIKENAHYLHLLTSSELNIDKDSINFNDLANISMGRISHLNSYLCIRSEKPTRAQVEKLYKKLEKYNKMKLESGKQTTHQGIGTIQSFVNEERNIRGAQNQMSVISHSLKEIIQLKKEIKCIQNSPSIKTKEKALMKELYTRIQFLVQKVYKKLVDVQKYPLHALKENFEAVEQLFNEKAQYSNLLWFILQCEEEITRNTPKQDNLVQILRRKPTDNHKITKYKGSSMINEHNLGITSLYTYRDKNKKVEKSKTPTKVKSKTPTKTPTKQPMLNKTYKYQKKNKQVTPTNEKTRKKQVKDKGKGKPFYLK